MGQSCNCLPDFSDEQHDRNMQKIYKQEINKSDTNADSKYSKPNANQYKLDQIENCCEKYENKDEFINDCITQLKSCYCNANETDENKQTLTTIIKNTITKLELSNDETLIENSEDTFENDDQISTFINILMDKVINTFLDSVLSTMDSISDEVEYKVNLYRTLQSLPILSSILTKDFNDAVPESIIDKSGIYHNWALSVKFKPCTFKYIKTKQDIIDSILDATASNCRVRCCQYGHSFSPLFGDDNNKYYLLIMQPKEFTTTNSVEFEQIYEGNDFNFTYIEEYKELMFVRDIGNNRISVGGNTPIWMYFNWCHKRYENGLSFPSETCNVLKKHVSFVGAVVVGCHGYGIMTKPLCDYVIEFKLIDYTGKEMVFNIDDGNINFKDIIVNFGLLGVITEITFQFEPMYYNLFQSKFISHDECDDKFEKLVMENKSFIQFMWFPNSENVWVVGCKRDESSHDRTDEKEEKIDIWPSHSTSTTFEIFQLTQNLIGMLAPQLLGDGEGIVAGIYVKLTKIFSELLINKTLNSDDRIKMLSCDSIHYLYGFGNNRHYQLEWMFPLDEITYDDGSKGPDLEKARKLWIFTIDFYNLKVENENFYGHTMPMQMAIFGGSECALAVSYGWKYCVVMTLMADSVDDEYMNAYFGYCNEIAEEWYSISEADKYGMRPHWARYSDRQIVKNEGAWKWLKNEHSEGIKRFNEYRKKIDPNNVFMNEHLLKIFE